MRILDKEKILARSKERLEYPELLNFLAGYCKSEPGKARALSLEPSQNLEKIKRDLNLLKEMMALFDSGLNPPIGHFSDFSQSLEHAEKGVSLTAKHFLELLKFLNLAEANRVFFQKVKEKFPGLGELAGQIHNFSELKSRIHGTVDEQGEIKDSASPDLARLRQELSSLRAQIQKKLEKMLNSEDLSGVIQDSFYTERDGRFVIPVKSSAQTAISGIVHDSSISGATVFLEPIEMVPLNNRLRILEREIETEIQRILAELSSEVSLSKVQLLFALNSLSELDLLCAKAELARTLSASIPQLSTTGAIRLFQVRHPLLILRGKDAIANDLVMGTDTRVLVLSGPNTGGKTVLLKTIGLLSLMIRAGMAIPAHPDSELGLFPEIYAGIGDEQSLSQDLSSYSAHLLDLLAFLNYAQDSSLVLIDEILGSTDPEEASALAMVILKELKKRNCLTMVTTHLSRLKAFAETEPGFINASFEFDPLNLTPTYHLRLGLPGPSYGIATARKLGLDKELIEEAEKMLDPESRKLIELVSQLDLKQTELDQRLRRLAEEEQDSQMRSKELDEKGRRLLEKEQEMKKGLRRELESELRSIKTRLNQIYEEARDVRSTDRVKSAEKEIARIRKELDEKYPVPDQGEEIASEEWQVGDLAWVKRLKIQAEVIGLNPESQEATLGIGSIRIQEKISGLLRIQKKREAQKRETMVGSESALCANPARSSGNTLDLRGKRAEDAEIELINYLDQSVREGKPAVYIIHGHGTGVLKKLVREYLASSSYVKSFRPGEQNEGGDGITLAVLENMQIK